MSRGLHSSMMDKGFEKGSDGFYFQHRKGRLDMRTLSKVDLDSIVRNVDIESLQEHLEGLCFTQLHEEDLRQYTDPMICKLFKLSQYTIEYLLHVQEQLASALNSLAAKYSKKKRSLLDKRKELVELKELSKSLKEQVKSKKTSLNLLEDMMKKVGSAKPAPEAEAAKPAMLKFFVAGPKGVCVEFSLASDTKIASIVKEARSAFVSRRTRHSKRGDVTIKLMFQGKWLLDDSSLQNCNVRNGDTIVVSIEEDSDDSEDEKPVTIIQAPTANLEEVIRVQSEAYKRMADDMRGGFESALKALGTRPSHEDRDPETLLRMEEKWTRVELSVRQQLDTQMTHYDSLLKELIVRDRRPVVGELEDDDDDQMRDLKSRFHESADKVKRLQSSVDLSDSELNVLRRQVDTQAGQIDDLRNRLNAVPAVVKEVVKVASPVELVRKVYEPVPEAPNMLVEPVVIKEPVFVPPVIKNVEEKEEEEEVEDNEEVQEPEEPIVIATPVKESEEVSVQLRSKVRTTDGRGRSSESDITVACEVYRGLSPDDLVFELRKAVADHFGAPLGRASLLLRGEVVMLGLDVDASFTATNAALDALSGALTYQISLGLPVTDAQLDHVASSIDAGKSNPDVRKSISAITIESAKSKRLEASKFKKIVKRSWSDDEDDELDDDLDDHRDQLQESLSEVSDRESLSQDEMEVRLRKLRTRQAQLPGGLSSHLNQFQRSVGKVLGQAGDSGSEEHYSTDKRANSVSMRLLRRGDKEASTNKSLESMRSSYSPRSSELFDRDEDGEDDQLVLMRSLGGLPQKSISTPDATSLAAGRRVIASQDMASSLIINEDVLHLRRSDSSSKSSMLNTSRTSTLPKRYSPPENTYQDDFQSESKVQGSQLRGEDSYSHVSSISRERDSKHDADASVEMSALSASTLSQSQPTASAKRASQTFNSGISDLTSSGLQGDGYDDRKSRSDYKRSEFNESKLSEMSVSQDSSSRPGRKSVEFSLRDEDKRGGQRDTTERTAMGVAEPGSANRTPQSTSSALSPFQTLFDDEGEESLALSESNDLFPMLDIPLMQNDSMNSSDNSKK